MKCYSYFNGKILPADKVMISISDLGMLRAFAVFDFLRTYNGKPFLEEEHLARLEKSAKIINLELPIPKEKIADITKKLLKKSGAKEASIRILLTGGKNYGTKYDDNKRTFSIIIENLISPPKAWFDNGIKVMTHEYERTFPRAKTTNYSMAFALQAERDKQGAREILYVKNGKVLEATTSNFFIFKGDRLITSKNNILIGTTRNFVLGFARDLFMVEERDIEVSELRQADEAFITATNKEILPVVKVNEMVVGNGKVGERTKKLMKIFRERVKNW